MVESTFGILSAVFRCLNSKAVSSSTEKCGKYSVSYDLSSQLFKKELREYKSLELRYSNNINESVDSEIIQPAQIQSSIQFHSLPSPAELVREEFAEYFCSKEGMVRWQYKYC